MLPQQNLATSVQFEMIVSKAAVRSPGEACVLTDEEIPQWKRRPARRYIPGGNGLTTELFFEVFDERVNQNVFLG